MTFPQDEEDKAAQVVGFSTIAGCPQLQGTLGSTHVALRVSYHQIAELINRKGFDFICDQQYQILEVDTKYPGSSHKADILENLLISTSFQSLQVIQDGCWKMKATASKHDGLKALCFLLSCRPNQSPSTDTLIRLTELVLTLKNFSFNSSHFLQTEGLAMGTCMDQSYACLFEGYVEQSLSCCYTGPIPHLLLLCYIDDCISAALCSHKELEQFINFTNTFHLNLKFTWTISDTSLSFLDLSVSISGDCLETDIYFK
eukprot:g26498.t1